MKSLSDEPFDSLIACLEQEDPALRRPVVWELGNRARADDPQAIPLLIQLLDDADWLVREDAGDALWSTGPSALPAVTQALADKSASLNSRFGAARILMYISDPSALQPLVDILEDDNEDTRLRSTVAVCLGNKRDGRALDPLASVVTDASAPAELRWHAAQALADLGDRRAVESLQNALKQEDVRFWNTRWDADVHRMQEGERNAPPENRAEFARMLNQLRGGGSLHDSVLHALRILNKSSTDAG